MTYREKADRWIQLRQRIAEAEEQIRLMKAERDEIESELEQVAKEKGGSVWLLGKAAVVKINDAGRVFYSLEEVDDSEE